MLRSVLIDVGGTLWPDRWPPSAERLYVRRLFEELELSAADAERLLVELQTRDPALVSPPPLEQDSSAMAADALEACGLTNVSVEHLLEVMDLPARGVIDLLPGAGEFLEQLKSLGLRTVVFSNATFRSSAGYRRDFRSFSVGELIDEVISSVDLGFRKPSDHMFSAALQAARCRPSECAIVGDSEGKDILPAIARGMRAVRVAIEKPAPEETAAHAVATSLDEAAHVLSSWMGVTEPMESTITDILADECERVTQVVMDLPEADFDRPTRCPPWDVKALLAHMWRDLFRIPTALNTPVPDRADTNAVTYWRSYEPTSDAPAIALHAQETASEYPGGRELANAFQDLWQRCIQLLREEGTSRVIKLRWGPAMRLEDFLKTRVVEMVVHGLDLSDALGLPPIQTESGIEITTEVLAGLLDGQPPTALGWNPIEFIEKGTGRVPLSRKDKSLLGHSADKFPLLA